MSRLTLTTAEKVQAQLQRLGASITACRLCPRLVAHREAVACAKRRQYRDWVYWGKPVPGFGDPRAQLILVGLAPAAHGANRTGRMFTGDSSGDWLYEALHRFGFASQPTSRGRDDGMVLHNAYVTAAARCAPPDNTPRREELDVCRCFLAAELRLLRSTRVVIALGRIAADAYLAYRQDLGLKRLSPRPVFAHGGVTHLPEGITLITSYHPSRQNTQTGRLKRAMWYSIFESARRLLD